MDPEKRRINIMRLLNKAGLVGDATARSFGVQLKQPAEMMTVSDGCTGAHLACPLGCTVLAIPSTVASVFLVIGMNTASYDVN